MGTGSWYEKIRGLRATSPQNSDRVIQWTSEEAARILESTLLMSSDAARKLSQKHWCLTRSKCAMTSSMGRLCQIRTTFDCQIDVMIWRVSLKCRY